MVFLVIDDDFRADMEEVRVFVEDLDQGGSEVGTFLGGGFGGEEHIRKCPGCRGSSKIVSPAEAPG